MAINNIQFTKLNENIAHREQSVINYKHITKILCHKLCIRI